MSPARWAARAAGTAGGAMLFVAIVVSAGAALLAGAYLRGRLP